MITLAMACPFEPVEKQALLEAPTDADRAATLLALLQMGAPADAAGHLLLWRQSARGRRSHG